ncbi:hypothetical protein KRM28CT15_67330 [Krasilnikovia sp. M28-CT-15]
MLMPRTEHQAARPSWECRACGQAWPCAAAKVELAEQYQRFPTGLAIYLGSCLVEAIDDWAANARGAAPDLYDRFLGWARGSIGAGNNMLRNAVNH